MHAFWWESVYALLVNKKTILLMRVIASRTRPIRFGGQTSGGVN